MTARHVLAIDIGGTKLAAGVVAEDGRQLSRGRVPTDVAKGPESAVERLVALCRDVIAQAGVPISLIGIGCGGPLDPVRGVTLTPPSLPGWEEFPLVARVQDALGVKAWLDNDANAAALGEHRFGAGRGYQHLVYFTVSTGVGGGVILDGRLYPGSTGNAAELGHIQVSYDGWPCPCGGQGCVEAFASGTYIAARARVTASPRLIALAGSRDAITTEHVVAAVRAGDVEAKKVWDDSVRVLAAGVASAINAFNPQRVIVGGGVTSAGPLLFEPLSRLALGRTMKSLAVGVDVVPAELGDQVGVMGAAAVALSHL
ncbi:MAG: ROK family protein [Myxococcaceae bacterium]|nr:ROK family protein [Myxococcaceae bacterium]